MAKHNHQPFENQIFHHFREQVKQIDKCIRFLVKHGYVVKDLEDRIIDKWNVDEIDKPYISYKRTPKRPYEKT